MIVNIEGQKFGRLTVSGMSGRDSHGQVTWACQCECGNTIVVLGGNLRRGKSQSCGCLHRELLSSRMTVHGEKGTKEHRAWCAMKSRCHNPKSKSFADYGARGITVCDRWKMSFSNFLADMGKSPSDAHTIDREHNDKGYEPGNCRWATRAAQAVNKRSTRYLEHQGEKLSLAEWCKRLGISKATVAYRLAHGWPLDKAVLTPPSRARREVLQ